MLGSASKPSTPCSSMRKTPVGNTNVSLTPPIAIHNASAPLGILTGQSTPLPIRTSPPRQRPPTDQQATTTLVTELNFSSFLHLLCLSFSIHEQLNIHRGLPKFSTYNGVQLTTSTIPAVEQHEYHTCRHSFPHVPQLFYPSQRPDGIPG